MSVISFVTGSCRNTGTEKLRGWRTRAYSNRIGPTAWSGYQYEWADSALDIRHRWVVTANLPAAPAGKVYQLWFVTPDSKISAGLISTDQNGHGFAAVPFPSSITQLDAAAITLEPEGGSEQPTMPIYLLGKPS